MFLAICERKLIAVSVVSEVHSRVVLSGPDFGAFVEYVVGDYSVTTWDSYCRRLFRCLGFPDDCVVPESPVVASAGMLPRMWHKVALGSGAYEPVLGILSCDSSTGDAAVLLESEVALAHGHPLAAVFLGSVRKFTAEQQALLSILASEHVGHLVRKVGVSALLGFLPADKFIPAAAARELGCLIEEEGLSAVVPLKPSQVPSSPLYSVVRAGFEALDDLVADLKDVPHESLRVCWLLTHTVDEWVSDKAHMPEGASVAEQVAARGDDASDGEVPLF